MAPTGPTPGDLGRVTAVIRQNPDLEERSRNSPPARSLRQNLISKKI